MMTQDRSVSAASRALSLLALLLAFGVFAGCEREGAPPELMGNLDDIRLAGSTILSESLNEARQQELAALDVNIRSLLGCEGEDALTCEVIEERFAQDPAYRSVFIDSQQLTSGGALAAESLFDVHTHALRPSRFQLPELRERLDRLASWQQGRAIIEDAGLTDEELTWLSRVSQALAPDEQPSRAELVTMLEGPDDGTMFPRRDRTVSEYRANFSQVARAAQEVNDLLLFGVLTYARIQKLDYTSTESVETLKERELLYKDPEDPREEEVVGGPARSREWLEPWRLTGIEDAEVDMEAVKAREDQLVRDRVAGFAQALLERDVETLLRDVEPQHEQYALLRAAFNRYRKIAAAGGWQTEPVDRYMREGSEGDDVVALRRRLAEEGFDVAPVENEEFDEQLKTAVLEFQESSQIPETGATDSATREVLAISARSRLATLARTLQQWRESPARRSFGEYYVHVNIPAFHADVRNEGETIYHYRVVVGKNSFDWSETVTETPTFSDRIERIVFNPFWHLPKSIIHNEVIPAVEENPDYIEEQNYEVRKRGSRIFIKQLPGPGNALGRVKFLFPNQFAVYMHDTPTRHLFSRVKRDFSHGCVRVHEPLELATLLMQRDRQWTRAQIDDFIQDALRKPDEDTVFHLDTPVPIHLDYLLARVDEHGYVEFYDDVYDRDSDALAQQQRVIAEWLDIAI